MRKLIIIGSGPAGYTAGIYAARADLAPLILAGEKSGGQLMDTTVVENWPGTKLGINGPDLMVEMAEQAKKFGAEIINKNVTKVDFSSKPFKVWVDKDLYEAESVIVSTGASSVMLGVPGEQRLFGRGVATCAVCDAPFYRGKTTVVVGGGDSAVEDTLALTKFAEKVILIVRRDVLRASKIMANRVINHPKVEIKWNTQLLEILGENKVEKIKIVNNQTKEESEIVTDGVFLAIGHKPVTELFVGQLDTDENGFLKTKMTYPNATATKIEGVFAAGDVVDYHYKQAVTAAGMGCQAALDAERYLENLEQS